MLYTVYCTNMCARIDERLRRVCREALLWGFEACLLDTFQLESGTSRIDPQLSQSCKVLLAASSLHKAARASSQVIRIAICWFQLSGLLDDVVLWCPMSIGSTPVE